MHLLAEFGGTNARFSMVDPSRPLELIELTKGACADFESAEDAIRWYMDKVGISDGVQAACISIAGPTDAAALRLTNRDWELDPERMKSLMKAERVEFLNDFEALAYALPYLPGENLQQIRPGERNPQKPMAVLGPGTGLGVAGLLPAGRSHIVVQSEGGGIGFAPADSLEREVMICLAEELGRVTCEDLLCGRGLVRLYGAVAKVADMAPKNYQPSDITQNALSDADALCVRAVESFCNILGHFAGDVALMFNAVGGVYLGGGMLEKMRPLFLASRFAERFADRGAKSKLVAATPVYMVEHEVPALIGGSYWLSHQIGRS